MLPSSMIILHALINKNVLTDNVAIVTKYIFKLFIQEQLYKILI